MASAECTLKGNQLVVVSEQSLVDAYGNAIYLDSSYRLINKHLALSFGDL